MDMLFFITLTNMYKLSETDVRRIITACEKYANDTGSEWMHDQYIHLVKKLCQYLDQNYNELDSPIACKIYETNNKHLNAK